MSEALSKETLLEYVKKAKQKIKKLEQDLVEEKEKSAAALKSSTISELSAFQDEISGGISAFFGIVNPTAPSETAAIKNDEPTASDEAAQSMLTFKDAEVASGLQREKKLKALIKTKMKENEEKDKEIQNLLAAQKLASNPQKSDDLGCNDDKLILSLKQQVVELTSELQKEQTKTVTKKDTANEGEKGSNPLTL